MNYDALKQKIVNQLGIEESNFEIYKDDIDIISKYIGNFDVLAQSDEAYNTELEFNIIKYIEGEIDNYFIVKFI